MKGRHIAFCQRVCRWTAHASSEGRTLVIQVCRAPLPFFFWLTHSNPNSLLHPPCAQHRASARLVARIYLAARTRSSISLAPAPIPLSQPTSCDRPTPQDQHRPTSVGRGCTVRSVLRQRCVGQRTLDAAENVCVDRPARRGGLCAQDQRQRAGAAGDDVR
jgi:hypothetical protein